MEKLVKDNEIGFLYKPRATKKGSIFPVFIIIGVVAIVGVIVAVSLIPVYISSSSSTETETVETAATFDPTGSTTVNRRRAILTGNTASLDTSTIDAAVVAFFKEQGATSVTTSWTQTATGQYSSAAVCIFDLVYDSTLSDLQVEIQANTLLEKVKTIFTERASAGTLLNIAVTGGSFTPTKSGSNMKYSFYQKRRGIRRNQTITTTTQASVTTRAAAGTTAAGTTAAGTTAAGTTAAGTTAAGTTAA